MKWLLIVVLALAVLLVGCGPPEEPQAIVTGGASLTYNTTRFIDVEAGVVCYEFKSGYAAGISCLPLVDTNLGK